MTSFEEQFAVALDVLQDNAAEVQLWALGVFELVAPLGPPRTMLPYTASKSGSWGALRLTSKSSAWRTGLGEVSWTGKGGDHGQAAWSDSSSAHDSKGMSISGQATETRPYAWDIEQ
jgi:hypothetical protein